MESTLLIVALVVCCLGPLVLIGWLQKRSDKQHLKDKYRITKAFLFIGYIPSNKKLYTLLRNAGYTIVFKPTA